MQRQDLRFTSINEWKKIYCKLPKETKRLASSFYPNNCSYLDLPQISPLLSSGRNSAIEILAKRIARCLLLLCFESKWIRSVFRIFTHFVLLFIRYILQLASKQGHSDPQHRYSCRMNHLWLWNWNQNWSHCFCTESAPKSLNRYHWRSLGEWNCLWSPHRKSWEENCFDVDALPELVSKIIGQYWPLLPQ